MKRLLFASAAALVVLLASSCTPMIENGHDHRYDPKFKDERQGRG